MSLSPEQINLLLGELHPSRVQRKQGQSHLEAWDVRRWLIRIFGWGGWSFEVVSSELAAERTVPNGEKFKHTVVYRVVGRLTIKDADGREVAGFEDGAAGDAVNQPSLGDAHDMALKTAMSQALKRCAVNLGDQFGLSLYNGGGTAKVVVRSIPHTAVDAPAPEMPADPEVKPEPEVEQQPDPDPPAKRSKNSEPGPWDAGTPQPPQPLRAVQNAPTPPADPVLPPEQQMANAAAAETDVEKVRALYRKASAARLLTATAVTSLGSMELGKYLISRSKQLSAPSAASGNDRAAAERELRAVAADMGLAASLEVDFRDSQGGIDLADADIDTIRSFTKMLRSDAA